MHAGTTRGRIRVSLALSVLLGALGGCHSDGSEIGAVCPSCEPHAGGETGDFGAGIVAPCHPVTREVEVDQTEATALGFDTPELLRRIARPIDGPLRWTAASGDEDTGGHPASGYQVDTRGLLRFSAPGTLHYVHPDPAACDGTTCTLPDGSTVEQARCDVRLKVEVSAAFETSDGAVKATLEGLAILEHPDSIHGRAEWLDPYFNVHADLSQVNGTLRLAPPPGGARYEGWLLATGFMKSDGTTEPAARATRGGC